MAGEHAPTVVALAEMVGDLTTEEWKLLRASLEEVLARIQEDRGGSYSRAVYWRKLDEAEALGRKIIQGEITRAVSLVAGDLKPPEEPTEALRGYQKALDHHAYLVAKMRIAADEQVSSEPPAVKNYRAACAEVATLIRERARAQGCYWLRPEVLTRVQEMVYTELSRRTRQALARKPAARGHSPAKFSTLAGEESRFTDERDDPSGFLSKAEARRLVKRLPLTFLEELNLGGISRAVHERQSESDVHGRLVRSMVGLLRRVGFKVYPGGVGIEGVYAMADLLAIRDDEVLFVECLTKKSIQKHQGHVRKRELALHVPLCLVGSLPSDFVATLPNRSYVISHPNAPRMSNGEWVPHFYRTGASFTPRFSGSLSRGRKVTKITITLNGLQLPEDVSGFLWTAIAHALFHHKKDDEVRSKGWVIKAPRAAIGLVPFEKYGEAYSSLVIQGHESELVVRLGSIPLQAELRGSRAALDLVISWLRLVHFPLDL
jgi:hypothetical protein